jgi:hypothetical protein
MFHHLFITLNKTFKVFNIDEESTLNDFFQLFFEFTNI